MVVRGERVLMDNHRVGFFTAGLNEVRQQTGDFRRERRRLFPQFFFRHDQQISLPFFFDLMRKLELAHDFTVISRTFAASAPPSDREDIGQPSCPMQSGHARDFDLR
jgi:hypothetical protein